MRVDLNADVGEGASPSEIASETALIQSVTSVNIACGAHAGDRATMRRVLEQARQAGIAVGAHPGYADPDGRGRRDHDLGHQQVIALVTGQIELLSGIAAEVGLTLGHVKPHGALYNQAARDPDIALAVAEAVHRSGRGLRLVALAGSALLDAGRRMGLPVAAEAFIDRRYRPDGSLVPRSEQGAVILRAAEAVTQALSIVCEGRVAATDGSWLRIAADTLCIHGDTSGAPDVARRVRAALEGSAVEIRPLP